MTCTDLTDVQRRTLAELAAGEPPTDQATVEQFRAWGWVMAKSLELTGTGLGHAGELPHGILSA